ncbi:prepilin-type N-terminal cleavage/methylation domain-containing protein [Amphritea sp. 1_MG-2023]|uniref:GspH/FimT family pseudopilin n=1 Tax=Amphritea sp. 1_MG-2023 TaxID=3062670 RepID=UPI0026E28298|nr:GspH/FimT family pseudopilin [Amphritea sp. 1_MG-2023]MDO6563080.1 prepilin-type N-terminal cleavage/methylation domain-containing protein [Amphritea sp. 1_MG-2023]
MYRRKRSGFYFSAGFTLIELLVSIAVLAILVTTVIPSFGSFIAQNRLEVAGESIFSDLNFARTEVITRGSNAQISVSFSTDGADSWCYGLSTNASCDCSLTDITDANACVLDRGGVSTLKTVSSERFEGVNMTSAIFGADNYTHFSALRSKAASGLVGLSTNSGEQLQISVTALGRLRICTPNASMTQYSAC